MLSHFLLNNFLLLHKKNNETRRFIIPKDGNIEARNISSYPQLGKENAENCQMKLSLENLSSWACISEK